MSEIERRYNLVTAKQRLHQPLFRTRVLHGAYDTNILGIDPDYKVVIKDSVLETFDGPTLQHALKEMHGAKLAQLPTTRAERPDRSLLDERFQSFLRAS